MASLQSISLTTKVFETTGSNPVKILCDDLNEYVCKYSRNVPASALFNEFLAAEFLKIWGLAVPNFNLVNIKPESIRADHISTIVQPGFFNRPCFGSQYNDFGKEMDKSMSVLSTDPKIVKKIRRKQDLLSIALFDLWMANEDRHHNNYNLLLNTDPEYYFVPIDHEKCLNTHSLALHRPLVMLTEDETLINTELTKLVFKDETNLGVLIEQVLENYYLCVPKCQKSLEKTINSMPEQWGIAKADKIALLNSSLFSENWVHECEVTFRDYTTRFIQS